MALYEKMARYRSAYRWRPYNKSLSPEFMDELFPLPKGTTRTMFCDLHSLVFVPEVDDGSSPDVNGMCALDTGHMILLLRGGYDDGGIGRMGEGGIAFLHKSLEDYLKDPERSEDLYQPRIVTLTDVAAAVVSYLHDWSKTNYERLSPGQPPSLLWFSLTDWNWAHRLSDLITAIIEAGTPTSSESLPKSIVEFDPRDLWVIRGILRKHDCLERNTLKSYFDMKDRQEDIHERFVRRSLYSVLPLSYAVHHSVNFSNSRKSSPVRRSACLCALGFRSC